MSGWKRGTSSLEYPCAWPVMAPSERTASRFTVRFSRSVSRVATTAGRPSGPKPSRRTASGGVPVSAPQCAATTVPGRPSPSSAGTLSTVFTGNGPQSSGSWTLAGSGAALAARALGVPRAGTGVPVAGDAARATATTAPQPARPRAQCQGAVRACPGRVRPCGVCCPAVAVVPTAVSTRRPLQSSRSWSV